MIRGVPALACEALAGLLRRAGRARIALAGLRRTLGAAAGLEREEAGADLALWKADPAFSACA
jgi:hypothetical protein